MELQSFQHSSSNTPKFQKQIYAFLFPLLQPFQQSSHLGEYILFYVLFSCWSKKNIFFHHVYFSKVNISFHILDGSNQSMFHDPQAWLCILVPKPDEMYSSLNHQGYQSEENCSDCFKKKKKQPRKEPRSQGKNLTAKERGDNNLKHFKNALLNI